MDGSERVRARLHALDPGIRGVYETQILPPQIESVTTMMKMKIGLLECDHVSDHYRHLAGDYREMFAGLLGRYAPRLSLEAFDVCNGQLPASPESCDGYICTGS